MAKRGGKGADPAAFGQGGSEGGPKTVPARLISTGWRHPHTDAAMTSDEIAQASTPEGLSFKHPKTGALSRVVITPEMHTHAAKSARTTPASELDTLGNRLGLSIKDDSGRERRVPVDERANVKGQRAEQVGAGTLGTKDFSHLVRVHYTDSLGKLRELQAESERALRPGYKGTFGHGKQWAAKTGHEAVLGYMTDMKRVHDHMVAADALMSGKNDAFNNNPRSKPDAIAANRRLVQAANALMAIHKNIKDEGIVRAATGADMDLIHPSHLIQLRNAVSRVPLPKSGKDKKHFSYGHASTLTAAVPSLLAQSGLTRAQVAIHQELAKQGRVQVGGPVHHALIAQAEQSGDKGELSKLKSYLRNDKRSTGGERENQAIRTSLGKGQRAGSSPELGAKIAGDFQTIRDNAKALGIKLPSTAREMYLEGTNVGRKKDPKKKASNERPGTGLHGTRVAGPKIGKNVANVTAGQVKAVRKRVEKRIKEESKTPSPMVQAMQDAQAKKASKKTAPSKAATTKKTTGKGKGAK